MAVSSASAWMGLMRQCVEADKRVFVQLATLTSEGLPSVRTVVFRGWHSGETPHPEMMIVSDLRSEKMKGLQGENNWAEVCYYSAATRQQLRLTGPLAVVGPDEPEPTKRLLRSEAWTELSDSARVKFCWPTPGDRRATGDSDAFKPEPPSSAEPEDTFGLLLLRPSKVDFYCSKTDVRELFQKSLDGFGWTREVVNP